jgi:amino acid adenylation domain-containing protein
VLARSARPSAGPVPGDALAVTDWIAAAAARTPAQVALRCSSQELTYAQLDARIEATAELLKSHGVGREVLVGLLVDRGADMVVAVHAVWRAGGAYLPLDARYPADRLAFMLEDSQVRLILGHEHLFPLITADNLTMLDMPQSGGAAEVTDQESPENNPESRHLDDLAYVIYTSGSSGKPKGVAITQRNLMSFVSWGQRTFSHSELAVCAATTSLSFDMSVFELVVPLAAGGSIRVFEDALGLTDPAQCDDLTLINVVPSVAVELARMHALPSDLRVMICGGEAFPRQLADRILAQKPGLRLINAYGPTEATVGVCCAELRAGDTGPVPVGVPFPHVQFQIVGPDLSPVGRGQWGELVIGGNAVARGYLNRPELTDDKFLTGFPVGQRRYRTGDRARQRPDGQYEISGRLDQQVKVRGYRIEIEEIEAALRDVPGIDAAVVVPTGPAGLATTLVAYLVTTELTPDPAELPILLAHSLPEWMIPNRFDIIDELPKLANGKLDRGRLEKAASQVVAHHEFEGRPPQTLLEQQVAQLMAELLSVDAVGVEQDFFADLAATSLLGVRLLTEIERTTGIRLPISTLVRAATPAAIARSLDAAGALDPQQYVVLQEGAPGITALYLLCPWLGQALGFQRLLRHLGMPEIPVIAVMAQQPDPGGSYLTSMQALQRHTTALIKQRQPHGPYWIGGYSLGGMLAHEVAAALHDSGEETLPVLLLDAHARPAGIRALIDEFRYAISVFTRGAQETRRHQIRTKINQLRRRRDRARADTQLEQDIRLQTHEAQTNARGGLAELDQLDAANFDVVHGWAPRRAATEALLVWTRERASYRGREDLGWRPYLKGGLRTVKFDSTHLGMMNEPDVARLATVLRPHLTALLRACQDNR